MLNSLMFLSHSFEALTCRRPSQDLGFFDLKCWRAVAGVTPGMVLTADIWHSREQTKCQAFVMNTTCSRDCQPCKLLILLQTWQWEGGKGAGEGQKDFKAKTLKTNRSFLPAQGVHQKRPCLKQSRGRKGEVEFCVLQSISIPHEHLL